MSESTRQSVPAFCPLCVSRCGCGAILEDGRHRRDRARSSTPNRQIAMCQGPRLARTGLGEDRLFTRCAAPGQRAILIRAGSRISWDEALSETAAALRRIAAESGPEAVAFGVTTSSGTAISDAQPWVDRLINAFGSPNNCNRMGDLRLASPVCARIHDRHRHRHARIMPRAGCILLWGHNPSTSLIGWRDPDRRGARSRRQADGIDPRHIGFAVKADLLAAGAARHRCGA